MRDVGRRHGRVRPHVVRRLRIVGDPQALRLSAQLSAGEDHQVEDREMRRRERRREVERGTERVQRLARKPGNELQLEWQPMRVQVPDARNEVLALEAPFHEVQHRVVAGLQPHLDEREVGAREQLRHLVVNELRPDLGVERDPARVVLGDEAADLLGARRVQVEHRVHQVDLVHVLRQPEPELLLHPVQVEAPVADGVVLVVKAEAAGEDAAALRLEADHAARVVDVPGEVRRDHAVEVAHDGRVGVMHHTVPVAPRDAGDIRQ